MDEVILVNIGELLPIVYGGFPHFDCNRKGWEGFVEF